MNLYVKIVFVFFYVKKRFHEHLGLSALSGKSMKTPVPSAISDHSAKCQTKPQYKNLKILCSNTNNEALLRIKESLFIHRDKPNLNIQGQSIKLNLFKGCICKVGGHGSLFLPWTISTALIYYCLRQS